MGVAPTPMMTSFCDDKYHTLLFKIIDNDFCRQCKCGKILKQRHHRCGGLPDFLWHGILSRALKYTFGRRGVSRQVYRSMLFYLSYASQWGKGQMVCEEANSRAPQPA